MRRVVLLDCFCDQLFFFIFVILLYGIATAIANTTFIVDKAGRARPVTVPARMPKAIASKICMYIGLCAAGGNSSFRGGKKISNPQILGRILAYQTSALPFKRPQLYTPLSKYLNISGPILFYLGEDIYRLSDRFFSLIF